MVLFLLFVEFNVVLQDAFCMTLLDSFRIIKFWNWKFCCLLLLTFSWMSFPRFWNVLSAILGPTELFKTYFILSAEFIHKIARTSHYALRTLHTISFPNLMENMPKTLNSHNLFGHTACHYLYCDCYCKLYWYFYVINVIFNFNQS